MLYEQIELHVKQECLNQADASHDFGHLKRVSVRGLQFAKEEGANELVVFAAAMLHDIVNLPKDHPESSKSSLLASQYAERFLKTLNFPAELIPEVAHAIHAHSFSARIETQTIEAKCLQDADRMEALGVLGLMRVFYTSGIFGASLLHSEDPEGCNRDLNDKKYALDHFVLKLLRLNETMKTGSGKRLAKNLSQVLENFRNELIMDHLAKNYSSSRFIIANAFYNAGKSRSPLFHLEDPLGKTGRLLAPDKYCLDVLLSSKDDYILNFVQQFQSELINSAY